jgi:Tfp pilus assembly protein PilX
MTRNSNPLKPNGQRGASLIFAIMTLVVMSLAGLALVRSVDIGALILGNIGFKQDATSASAAVTQQAIDALDTLKGLGNLENDRVADGYYASSRDNLDPTGGNTSAANPMDIVDWLGDGNCGYAAAGSFNSTGCLQAKLGTSVNGSTVRWVITRLCQSTGATNAPNQCLKPPPSNATPAANRGALDSSGTRPVAPSTSPYYRIIVRTEGARNTVSFTEAMVHY